MLPIKLHTLPTANTFSTYGEAISHLSSNTVALYRGEELRPLGKAEPSYDVSQVCCWVSEQPLTNGRGLCTLNNAHGNIKIISEPNEGDEDGDIAMEPLDDNIFTTIEQVDPKDLLLISGDCLEGLKMSLKEFADKNKDQTLIKNPLQPDQYVPNPFNSEHYILPTFIVYYNHSEDIPIFNVPSGELMDQPLFNAGYKIYNAQDCFIYTKKTALIQQLVSAIDENDMEVDDDISKESLKAVSEALEEFLFVEANPALPFPLYVMAQNTIRLFRLNSRYYQYAGQDYHHIAYNTSKNELYYDDLRLEGRMQAYKRARKSLNQLKHLRSLVPDQETIDTFISQYKILMELSGYRSTWATVFNEGGDPGGFNDILGGIPAPTAPVPGEEPSKMPPGVERKRDLVVIVNLQILVYNIKNVCFNGESVNINNIDTLNEGFQTILKKGDCWEDLGNGCRRLKDNYYIKIVIPKLSNLIETTLSNYEVKMALEKAVTEFILVSYAGG